MYQRIRRIIALSNQIALILKCVDSVNSERSFKSVKLLYNWFLNIIILPQCLISHDILSNSLSNSLIE